MLASRNHWRDYLKETVMKKEDIRINGYYSAKVSDKLTVVRIVEEHHNGGWLATNTKTGKQVRIKSAAKLRGEVKPDGTPIRKPKATKPVAKDATPEKTTIETQEDTIDKEDAAEVEPGVEPTETTPDATEDTSEPAESHTVQPSRRGAMAGEPGVTSGKKLGCLNAAVEVLKLHPEEPLNCKRMIELMAEHNLWQSKAGATPHNTLYAAILREINTKGDASRFDKVERGSFKLKSQS